MAVARRRFDDAAIANKPPRDANLRFELAHQHRRACSGLAVHGDEARLAGTRFVEPTRERSELLRSAGESVDRQRTAERFVVMERRGARPVATLVFDSLRARSSAAVTSASNELPCSGAEADPIERVSRPSPSPNEWMRTAAHSRSPTDRPSSAVAPARTMMSFPSLPPTWSSDRKRVSDDLGDRAEARFGGTSGGSSRRSGGSTSATRTATGRFGAAPATAAWRQHELVRGADRNEARTNRRAAGRGRARPEAFTAIPTS